MGISAADGVLYAWLGVIVLALGAGFFWYGRFSNPENALTNEEKNLSPEEKMKRVEKIKRQAKMMVFVMSGILVMGVALYFFVSQMIALGWI